MSVIEANNNRMLIKFSIGLAILLSLIMSNLLILIPVILLIGLNLIYGQRFAIGIILIGYLTATTKYAGDFRIYINIFITIILIYFFLKQYGLHFNEYPKPPTEIILFLATLFLCLTLSSVFSVNPITGFYSIITTFIFFIICYLFYALLEDMRNLYTYIYSIFVIVIILSLSIITDLFRLGSTVFFLRGLYSDEVELYSMIRYTEFVIFFISLILLISLHLLKEPNERFYRIFIKLLIIFNIIILVLANSRGGILAAIVSSSFLFLVIKGRKFIKVLFFSLIVIIILLNTYPILEEALDTYFRWDTVGQRELFWQSGIDIFKDFPIFGIGPNHYPKYFGTYAPAGIYEHIGFSKLTNPTPHSLFLRFAAENGLLGIVVSFSFFVMFFYIGIRTMRLTKNKNREYFILSTAITGIGIGMFFRAFIEVTGILSYGYLTLDLPFWLVFIILISIYQKFNFEKILLSEGQI